jgi:hypothetical protein
VTGCYYRRLGADGDRQTFESTDITCSNWDPAIQHGSPPLALLTRAIIELLGDSPMRPGRLRARESIGPDGIGVTSAEIFDRTGFVGTCAQTLLVQRR